jgi:hypothetical protein
VLQFGFFFVGKYFPIFSPFQLIFWGLMGCLFTATFRSKNYSFLRIFCNNFFYENFGKFQWF